MASFSIILMLPLDLSAPEAKQKRGLDRRALGGDGPAKNQ
jgi:hypothetical protein